MAIRRQRTAVLNAVLGGFFGGVFLTSCAQEATQAGPELHEQVAPKVAIELPAPPDFDGAMAAAKPVDGIYSTWGLIYDKQKLIDKVVRVRGKIVEVSDDCPNLTKPRKRKSRQVVSKCQSLSVVIADDDDLHTIRVTGYHPYYHPHFKVGMELDITGQYVEQTRFLGMVYVEPDNGLIVAHRLHGMGVNRAGKFTTNRNELSQMIARGELLEIKHAMKETD